VPGRYLDMLLLPLYFSNKRIYLVGLTLLFCYLLSCVLRYTAKSDVWSYGVLLYELWSKAHRPYGSWKPMRLAQEIYHGYRLPPPSKCPQELYCLMMECWNPDPAARPSFGQLTVRLPSSKPLPPLSWCLSCGCNAAQSEAS